MGGATGLGPHPKRLQDTFRVVSALRDGFKVTPGDLWRVRRQELRRRSEDRCPRGRGPGPPVWRERPRRALGAPADGAGRGPKIRGTQIPTTRPFLCGSGCLDVVWARVGCGRRPVPTALCWRVGNPANGTAWMGRFGGRRCPERRTLAWILGQVSVQRLKYAVRDVPQDTFRPRHMFGFPRARSQRARAARGSSCTGAG